MEGLALYFPLTIFVDISLGGGTPREIWLGCAADIP